MKKIIYTFIFFLPIILLSCSGSSNEAELKSQLEIAEQKNQDEISNLQLENSELTNQIKNLESEKAILEQQNKLNIEDLNIEILSLLRKLNTSEKLQTQLHSLAMLSKIVDEKDSRKFSYTLGGTAIGIHPNPPYQDAKSYIRAWIDDETGNDRMPEIRLEMNCRCGRLGSLMRINFDKIILRYDQDKEFEIHFSSDEMAAIKNIEFRREIDVNITTTPFVIDYLKNFANDNHAEIIFMKGEMGKGSRHISRVNSDEKRTLFHVLHGYEAIKYLKTSSWRGD